MAIMKIEDVEIIRLTFASHKEADEQMPEIMDNFSATYGSGACGFCGVVTE